jgi:hypothetical protein
MSEPKQGSFSGWAVCEVFGHQRYVGYVTTEAYGTACLFRVDVPRLEGRERVTKAPEYAGDGRVTEGPVEAYTKLLGPGSIFAITPCTEQAAMKAVESTHTRPLLKVDLPPSTPMLTTGQYPNQDDDLIDEEHDDADH